MIGCHCLSVQGMLLKLVILLAVQQPISQHRLDTRPGCNPIKNGRPAFYISVVRKETKGSTLLMRLSNNSECDLYLASLRRHGGLPRNPGEVFSIRNGAEVEIVYSIDGDWTWGHSFHIQKLKGGRYVVFKVPLSELRAASTISIPVNFDDVSSYLSPDTPQVMFKFENLPKGILH